MPITTKVYRKLCVRAEHKANTDISNHRHIRDTFWRMAVTPRLRNHRYYRKQYRKLRTGEQTEIIFAKESHKATQLVEDADGNMRTIYDYAMSVIKSIDELIAATHTELEQYQKTLKLDVVE